jgi:DNA polymerase-1
MIYTIGCWDRLFEDEEYKESTVENCLNYFSNHKSIQLDTETKGKDPHSKALLSLQLGDSDNQWVIDVRKINILDFKKLIEDKIIIGHNLKFDYKFLKHAGITLNKCYDTMLTECVLYCGYDKWGYGLDKLAQRYLDVTLDKSTRGDFFRLNGEPFNTDQILYAARDVKYLHKIAELQYERVKKYNLEYCVNLENEVFKSLADIEYNGMTLNREKWLNNTNTFKQELDDLEAYLDKVITNEPLLQKFVPKYIQSNLFDEPERAIKINYASPLQIKDICNTLGYDIDSTNDRELTKLADKHEFFKVLQDYREKAKIISTYGEGFLDYINPNTNRVHTSFWQVLNTGRVSSGSKDDNAPNLQNIPAKNIFRNCFEARPGYLWVSIDYSGQELNLMADGSGEEGFIDVLNRGEDLHCYAGSLMFKKTITKADKDLRNKAKTINFGKPYGMGPNKLADTLQISIEEAETLFKEYGIAFPKLNKWLDTQAKLGVTRGYSETFAPCRRKRFYPELEIIPKLREEVKSVIKGSPESKALWKQILQTEGQVQRNSMNSPIQGSGADITKEALIGVRELIDTYNNNYINNQCNAAYLICTVHDAIDVEVKEDLANQFAKEMEDIMIKAGNKYVSKVQMKVDTTITKEWIK